MSASSNLPPSPPSQILSLAAATVRRAHISPAFQSVAQRIEECARDRNGAAVSAGLMHLFKIILTDRNNNPKSTDHWSAQEFWADKFDNLTQQHPTEALNLVQRAYQYMIDQYSPYKDLRSLLFESMILCANKGIGISDSNLPETMDCLEMVLEKCADRAENGSENDKRIFFEAAQVWHRGLMNLSAADIIRRLEVLSGDGESKKYIPPILVDLIDDIVKSNNLHLSVNAPIPSSKTVPVLSLVKN